MRRVLVTGAAGFIGSHVARELVQRRCQVRALVQPGERLANIQDLDLDIERVEGDVRDKACLARVMQSCDAVFHLASVYAVWTRDPNLIMEVNVGGTRNVFEAALASGVGRVVLTTSQAVWAGLRPGTLIDEEIEPNTGGCVEALGDLYCASKYRAHLLVREYSARGLDVVSVAPAVPFGPGDLRPTPTGQILTSIVNLPVFTYIESTVNPIDVRDVAHGHVLAWEHGRRGASYLLGGPHNLSMAELIAEVSRQAGIRRISIRVPYRVAWAAAHAMKWWADHLSRSPPLIAPGALAVARIGFRLDCRRAATELGLKVRPYQESIRDALSWFAARGYLRKARAVRHLLGDPSAPAWPRALP